MTYKDFFRERQEAFKDFERFAACGSLSAGQPAGSDMRRQPHHNRSKKPHRPVAPRAVYDIDNRFIALFEAGSGTAGEGISGAAAHTLSSGIHPEATHALIFGGRFIVAKAPLPNE